MKQEITNEKAYDAQSKLKDEGIIAYNVINESVAIKFLYMPTNDLFPYNVSEYAKAVFTASCGFLTLTEAVDYYNYINEKRLKEMENAYVNTKD